MLSLIQDPKFVKLAIWRFWEFSQDFMDILYVMATKKTA